MFNKNSLQFCMLFFLAAFSCKAVAQAVTFKKKNTEHIISKRLLSVEDGLASREVFCGLQDKEGFIWFGTRNGLNRYDGRNFLLFTAKKGGLREDKVIQLASDNNNRLFIMYGMAGFKRSVSGKVDVMDFATHEVKTLTATFSGMPFKEEYVYWISNDGDGGINLLTGHPYRLWNYSPKSGFTLRCEMKEWSGQDERPAITDYSTLLDNGYKDKNLLLKTRAGDKYYYVNTDTAFSFLPEYLSTNPIGFTNTNDFLFLYSDDGNITYHLGKTSKAGVVNMHPGPKNYGLAEAETMEWNNIMPSVNDGSCLFYKANKGFYLWKDSLFLHLISSGEIKGFENMLPYQGFVDRQHYLWICTALGVLQLKIEKNHFRQYFTKEQQQVVRNNQARGIYADDSGNVYANIWNTVFVQKKNSTKATPVYDIKYALIKQGTELYAGGFDLYRLNETENRLVQLPGSAGSEIWSAFSLNDSMLLLGKTNGFFLYNIKAKKTDSLYSSDKSVPAARFVYRFFKDKDSVICAVAENGLYELKFSNGTVLIDRCRSSLIDNLSLLDGYKDNKGTFWLATNGEGLCRWDKKANSFQQFNTTSGLPSDILYRIEADESGNLWISSDYGLVRFNSNSFSIKTYTVVDGISHNEFNRISSFKAANGQLFFGGLDGVNAFYPKDFAADTSISNIPLRIISFNQYTNSQNTLVNKTQELLATNRIELAPNDKFFTLEFQLLDFTKDGFHRYAYRIDGVDQDWNYIRENSVRISGLPYGNFTLHVKGQNLEGVWSKNILSIPLTVIKPFYLRWWFIAAMILLLCIGIYLLIYFRTKQLTTATLKLEQQVSERTSQLQQSLAAQGSLLQEKDVLLKEIHHRVKNNLQVISSLLELQSKGLTDEVARNVLREGRNRVRSIALIHQNLYQFENLGAIEAGRFVKDLCQQVQSIFSNEKQVDFEIKVPTVNLDIDTAVPFGLILNELLTNSYKHAFNDRKRALIQISINDFGDGHYQLLYFDSGPGMPVDFDLRKTKSLGMQLIHDLSRQIGGKLHYEHEKESKFIIPFTNRETRKNED